MNPVPNTNNSIIENKFRFGAGCALAALGITGIVIGILGLCGIALLHGIGTIPSTVALSTGTFVLGLGIGLAISQIRHKKVSEVQALAKEQIGDFGTLEEVVGKEGIDKDIKDRILKERGNRFEDRYPTLYFRSGRNSVMKITPDKDHQQYVEMKKILLHLGYDILMKK